MMKLKTLWQSGERYGKELAYRYYHYKFHFSKQFDNEISALDMLNRCAEATGSVAFILNLGEEYSDMDKEEGKGVKVHNLFF
jgi:hypothetical protein